MYDIPRTRLVFETQCHNAVTGKFHGYIFRLFEQHASCHREQFFSHIAEAMQAAIAGGWDFTMDSAQAPELVTALDYVLNADPYAAWPRGAEGFRTSDAETRTKTEPIADVGAADLHELIDEAYRQTHQGRQSCDERTIDWFGDE